MPAPRIVSSAPALAPCMAVAAVEVCQPPHGPQAPAEQPFKTLVGAALDPAAEPEARCRVTSLVSIRGTCSTPPIRRRTMSSSEPPIAGISIPAKMCCGGFCCSARGTKGSLLLAESERKLRAKSFLHDARVIANIACGDEIDGGDPRCLVPSPSFGFTRTGGEERLTAGMSNSNLLGTGTVPELSHFDNPDRKGLRGRVRRTQSDGQSSWTAAADGATDDGRGRHAWSACRAARPMRHTLCKDPLLERIST